jgi:hypothetical protein
MINISIQQLYHFHPKFWLYIGLHYKHAIFIILYLYARIKISMHITFDIYGSVFCMNVFINFILIYCI